MTDREAGAGPSPMARELAYAVMREVLPPGWVRPEMLLAASRVANRELSQSCMLPKETVEKAIAAIQHQQWRNHPHSYTAACSACSASNEALSALRRALEGK